MSMELLSEPEFDWNHLSGLTVEQSGVVQVSWTCNHPRLFVFLKVCRHFTTCEMCFIKTLKFSGFCDVDWLLHVCVCVCVLGWFYHTYGVWKVSGSPFALGPKCPPPPEIKRKTKKGKKKVWGRWGMFYMKKMIVIILTLFTIISSVWE